MPAKFSTVSSTLGLLALSWPASAAPSMAQAPPLAPERLPLAAASAPALTFVENRGQWPEPVRFMARSGPATAWFEDGVVVLTLDRWGTAAADRAAREQIGCGLSMPRDEGRATLRLRLPGSGAVLRGVDELPGRRAYYLGRDPARYRTDVRGYGSLRYEQSTAGVDISFRAAGATLAYDLHLAAGVDPTCAEFELDGIVGLEVSSDGRLIVDTGLGCIAQSAPVSWQVDAYGRRMPRPSCFHITGPDRYRFMVDDRDPNLPLVIDPGFDWSTFVGGSNNDTAWDTKLDAAGRVWIAGHTLSPDYPVAGSHGGGRDAIVTCLDPTQVGAAQLVWAAYVGGGNDEVFYDMALSAGWVTLVGWTTSTDYPTTANAWQPAHQGGGHDGVLTMFAVAAPQPMLYSTHVGTAGHDRICAVGEQPPGTFTVFGFTNSPSLPVTPAAYDTTWNGSFDAFVAKLEPLATPQDPRRYVTYLGGSAEEGLTGGTTPIFNMSAADVHVAADGSITVASRTESTDLPTTPGAYQAQKQPTGADIFVTRFDPTLATLSYSSYLGGPGDDWVNEIRYHGPDLVLAGHSWSPQFPGTALGYQPTWQGAEDALVAVLRPQGNGLADLRYATYLGGPGNDSALGLSIDSAGIVTVVGQTEGGFTGTAGACQPSYPGGTGASFAMRLEPANGGVQDAHYLTHIGTNQGRTAVSHVVEQDDGRSVIVGWTTSPTFPTLHAYQTNLAGGWDLIVARSDLLPTGTERFGTATPACLGAIDLQVNSQPAAGNASFEVLCTDAPSGAIGVLGIGDALPAPGFSLFNATVWVAPWGTVGWIAHADGYARLALPIPAGTAGTIALQCAWLNPATCPGSGLLSTSNGLILTW